MKIAPPDKNEEARIRALHELEILDTGAEQNYDDLTMLASSICGTPIALVSLIDIDRQWFKSRVGLDACETSRDLAFCAHAILQPGLFFVPDTLLDDRFADNPLVTGDPRIRFYAGAPLVDSTGSALGTLCVIDRNPRALDDRQQQALVALARQVVSQFELRRKVNELHKINESKKQLITMLSHDLRNSFNVQINFAERLLLKLSQWSPTQIADCATTISHAAREANRLLSEVLEWSRVEIGEFKLNTSAIDVRALMHDIERSCLPQAMQKNVSIVMPASPPLCITGDKPMLECILKNLITNAIKFSNSGGAVSLQIADEPDRYQFRVIDCGVGMDQARASQLFCNTHFESTRGTAGEAGTGIGTRLIQHFVAAHHGSIDVESSPGKGTSVCVSIPKPQ